MYVDSGLEKKTGKHFMTVRQSVRIDGKVTKRKVKSLGYIEDYLDLYDDPLKHFKALYAEKSKKQQEANKKIHIELDPTLKLDEIKKGEIQKNRKNLGASVLSIIYHQLQLDHFVNNHSRKYRDKFNANSILRFLIYCRILYPGSKMASFEYKDGFFEKMDFSLQDIYRFMDRLITWKDDLFIHLNKQIIKNYNRDTTLLYYDVTNYYFEVDDADEESEEEIKEKLDPNAINDCDGDRKYGVSKEHRPNPIIQMGLFMDEDGIPVNYRTFKGNLNDCKTLKPMMNATRLNLDLTDVIIVGDKGMMSGDNISTIKAQNNGYVISYSVRGASKEFKEYVTNEDDYQLIDLPDYQRYEKIRSVLYAEKEGDTPKLKIKSRIAEREIEFPDLKDPEIKHKMTIKEKQIVFYSAKYAKNAKEERDKVTRKAKEYISKHNTIPHSHGRFKYMKQKDMKHDGELVGKKGEMLLFDDAKVKEEEALDGYYVICTNVEGLEPGEKPFTGKSRISERGFFQLNKTVNDYDIIKMYRGLWEIEETFKITKSNLEARPVYHNRKRRIESHFLICFLSLIVVRLLEKQLDSQYTTNEIITSLQKASGSRLDANYYIFDYYNFVLKGIDEKLGTTFDRQNLSVGEIRKIIGKTKNEDFLKTLKLDR